MSDLEIKQFVQETLGCGCPEDVFQKVDCRCGITVDGIPLRVKINVGNRLLIYIAEVCDAESVKNILPPLLMIGKKERDDLSFNRFRLVLAGDNPDEIKKSAEPLFRDIVKDEKIHLHIVQKTVIPL